MGASHAYALVAGVSPARVYCQPFGACVKRAGLINTRLPKSRDLKLGIANHPAYTKARDRLVSRLRASVFGSPRPQPIVFLCGKRDSYVRPLIKDYLAAHSPELLVFYADTVWEHVKDLENLNALEIEEELGRFADALVIVVESPGTFAELGAFSLSPELRRKLLIVLDSEYQGEPSFINTGPVRWIDKESRFKPSLHCSFDSFGPSLEIIRQRLNQIPQTGRLPLHVSTKRFEEKPKNLLFLISDIVSLIGPATRNEILDVFGKVLTHDIHWTPHGLLGLAASLEFVKSFLRSGDTFYHRPIVDGVLSEYLPKRGFDVDLERSRFIQSYQIIPGAWTNRFGG